MAAMTARAREVSSSDTEPWHARAACQGLEHDHDLIVDMLESARSHVHNDPRASLARAAEPIVDLCRNACPVKGQCLEDGTGNYYATGVYGGQLLRNGRLYGSPT